MDDTGSVLGVSAGGGILSIILYFMIRMCYKKELHTKIKSGCCETSVDIEDNSSPVQIKT
jgi:hypothetical protein